jgi:hypothetical protein
VNGSRIGFVVALVVTTLALAGCGGGGKEAASKTPTVAPPPSTSPVLKGRVGPGFTIRLTKENGEPVKSVPAGAYYIEVDDLSEMHNFHLTGPGVDEKTPVDATGTARWGVRLKKGTYTYVCDAHKSSMHGSFMVTGG